MIQHFDLHQLPGTDEVARHFDIGLARRRVAAWVVVHQDDGRGRRNDGSTEHLARMHQQRVHQADGHKLMPLHTLTRVQEQHREAFTLRVEVRVGRNVQPPIVSRLIGRIAYLHGFRNGAIPQGNHLVFLGIELSHGPPRFLRTSGRE